MIERVSSTQFLYLVATSAPTLISQIGSRKTSENALAKSAMDLSVQKLSKSHPCDRFETYLTYVAQSHQKSRHVEVLAHY